MNRPSSYNTRQSEAILSYIASLGGSHTTAGEITEHFAAGHNPISLTTVYRHLERLVENGTVRKFTTDGSSGACYQHTGGHNECVNHFHLKCASCGDLLHLECGMMNEISRHVLEEHDFKLDSMRTVFYGKCSECIKKETFHGGTNED